MSSFFALKAEFQRLTEEKASLLAARVNAKKAALERRAAAKVMIVSEQTVACERENRCNAGRECGAVGISVQLTNGHNIWNKNDAVEINEDHSDGVDSAQDDALPGSTSVQAPAR